ncbi:MAG: hypothetical protein A2X32_08850 [Elusimicrobia bacterium GWC2_64_44]|nr:MAG: hypothetical protein A2X32_08850 [Elusimicrobia bacterium GWC2_64_44]
MNWLLRLRGLAWLCLNWAVGWAVAGLLIGVTSLVTPFLPWDAFFRVFDAPLPALGLPGFIGGAIFSILIGLAERGNKFEELSLPRFGAWGAAAGLLLSLVPAAMAAAGLATINHPEHGVWKLTALIGGPLTLLGAASGAASLLLARLARLWRTPLLQLLASE